jgi:hypothetical protein
MSYRYSLSKSRRSMMIKKDLYDFSLFVTELSPTGNKVEWDIERLKISYENVKKNGVSFLDSFNRTKSWVKNNHPELLL